MAQSFLFWPDVRFDVKLMCSCLFLAWWTDSGHIQPLSLDINKLNLYGQKLANLCYSLVALRGPHHKHLPQVERNQAATKA